MKKSSAGFPFHPISVKGSSIISSIIPFASSALMLLIVDTQYMVAKILAILGFVYLIISVALIVMIPMLRIYSFTGQAGQDVVS